MKVVHISASERHGGAALAALHLHRALLSGATESRLLVNQKSSDDQTVQSVADALWLGTMPQSRADVIQRVYRDRNRTSVSNTHFSLPLIGSDLSQHELVQSADVIHLHWIASFQTPWTLSRLWNLGKPIVWTLHDCYPFTGGCHFPAGCRGFESTCSPCSQLVSDPYSLPAAFLSDKRRLWSTNRLTFIAPSKWIADQARRSSVFGAATSISTIPYCVDIRVFRPQDRIGARRALGLPQSCPLILCGADQGEETRKGFPVLSEVLSACSRDSRFRRQRGRIVVIGERPSSLGAGDLPLIILGRRERPEELALAYAAADAFVMASQEDNLPNMLLESLACGIPVVAFAVGGIPEVLEDGVNGRLLPLNHGSDMACALLDTIFDRRLRVRMGNRGRQLIERDHSYTAISRRHVALYRDLIAVAGAKQSSIDPPPRGTATPEPDPGPEVGARLAAVSLYCLSGEIEHLARERATHVAELAARLTVIDVLEKHRVWSEAELSARLRANDELGARCQRLERELREMWERAQPLQGTIRRAAGAARSRIFGALERMLRLVRFHNWWNSKIPPVLAVAYIEIIRHQLDLPRALLQIACLVCSLCCLAAFGHAINDVFDVKVDELAGKPNQMAHLSSWKQASICSVLAAVALLSAAVGGYPSAAWVLLCLNMLWPTLYSGSAIRLKERGLLGVVCDVAGSHVTPTLLALSMFNVPLATMSLSQWTVPALFVVWACALGVKGIVYHQLADRECDSKAAVATLATEAAPGQIERWLPHYHLGIELPVSLLLVGAVVRDCPHAAIAFLAYLALETAKYRLGFQFALSADPRSVRPSFPFVNEAFYTVWFPGAAAVGLTLAGGEGWAWILIAHVTLFRSGFVEQANEARAACAQWYKRIYSR